MYSLPPHKVRQGLALTVCGILSPLPEAISSPGTVALSLTLELGHKVFKMIGAWVPPSRFRRGWRHGGQSPTCGHEAVRGQQKLWGDLHPHLRVRKLKQGEVMPLPLPVRDPLLFPIVGCGPQGTECSYLRITVGFWRFTVDDITVPLRGSERMLIRDRR